MAVFLYTQRYYHKYKGFTLQILGKKIFPCLCSNQYSGVQSHPLLPLCSPFPWLPGCLGALRERCHRVPCPKTGHARLLNLSMCSKAKNYPGENASNLWKKTRKRTLKIHMPNPTNLQKWFCCVCFLGDAQESFCTCAGTYAMWFRQSMACIQLHVQIWAVFPSTVMKSILEIAGSIYVKKMYKNIRA